MSPYGLLGFERMDLFFLKIYVDRAVDDFLIGHLETLALGDEVFSLVWGWVRGQKVVGIVNLKFADARQQVKPSGIVHPALVNPYLTGYTKISLVIHFGTLATNNDLVLDETEIGRLFLWDYMGLEVVVQSRRNSIRMRLVPPVRVIDVATHARLLARYEKLYY